MSDHSGTNRVVPRIASIALVALVACVGEADTKRMAEVFAGGGTRPDALPVMINKQLPFRYPPALYARKVQGNTTLRIHIDSNGNVNPDSTIVAEPSGEPALDSAAVVGSRELRFVPAKKDGEGIAISILFPVYWRHPSAPPLPGDTILKRYQQP
jgi:TonB family protein